MKKRFVFGLFLSALFLLFAVPVLGRVDIVSYCDVSLESCRAQDQALLLLEEKYPHDLSVDYMYYFDTDNAKSSMAQIALECANRQGMKDEYKLYLQEHLDDLSRSALKTYAESVGLVAMNFTFCLDTQTTAWDVLDQVSHADEEGVSSAPSVRLNMDIYSGSQTYTSLHTLVLAYLGLSEDEEEQEETEESLASDESVEETEESETTEESATNEYESSFEEKVSQETHPETSTGAELEEPLFFRVIGIFRVWLLGVFS